MPFLQTLNKFPITTQLQELHFQIQIVINNRLKILLFHIYIIQIHTCTKTQGKNAY
jgi:hypothetical protein